ncbi:hypothetical protein Pla123a_35450 [Posidoniimonas polymericola]|uniref:Uncharacterized protein n=1 Tax=Posidoniimonas polymericola TaxID=2528002 RepID=A0A5C5YHY1_9BACT|nr:hypothetical protein [Posidoniimonas polymericola]TWT73652.1 hypothetical protein Pla123a_35450 [Posidoniimonas polymericola]
MIKHLLDKWTHWIGDRSLERAIQAELRRMGCAVHAAKIRRPRLIGIERPGWVQVRRFEVETLTPGKQPITLQGLIRDDGRRERPQVLLTTDLRLLSHRADEWCDGLIRRG